jgi:hypothetical protein
MTLRSILASVSLCARCLMVLATLSFFVACSDDDDDNSNASNETPGDETPGDENPGSGDEPPAGEIPTDEEVAVLQGVWTGSADFGAAPAAPVASASLLPTWVQRVIPASAAFNETIDFTFTWSIENGVITGTYSDSCGNDGSLSGTVRDVNTSVWSVEVTGQYIEGECIFVGDVDVSTTGDSSFTGDVEARDAAGNTLNTADFVVEQDVQIDLGELAGTYQVPFLAGVNQSGTALGYSFTFGTEYGINLAADGTLSVADDQSQSYSLGASTYSQTYSIDFGGFSYTGIINSNEDGTETFFLAFYESPDFSETVVYSAFLQDDEIYSFISNVQSEAASAVLAAR